MFLKKTISLLVIIIVVASCSTKKNTFVSRNYHNLTAHYNVYFNANESFKLAAKKVEDSNKDNYTQLLDIFPSSKKENLSGVGGDMDYVITKGGKLIKKHSITAKPNSSSYAKKHPNQKEYNNWVDDAYLLVAKAQFYKMEFNECVTTCKDIIRDYPETSSKHEAIIWMGRALIELKEFESAKTILDNYDISTGAPKSLLGFYMGTLADWNIRQEKFSDAIPYMKIATQEAAKKDMRIRYNFILAQLYQQIGNNSEASLSYQKVIDLNPSYEITFNAKVKQASILLKDANPNDIKKELYKLLRNKKTIDFQDRIYYALGKVSLMENDAPSALENFQKSVETSKDNTYQQAVSLIQMGDIYYQQKQFRKSFESYNRAVELLDPASKESTAINDKYESITKLVEQVDIAHYEDSLQNLSKLPAYAQEAAVLKIIGDLQKAEIAKQQAIQDSLQNSQFDNSFDSNEPESVATGQIGKWYFYNPVIMQQGKVEFDRRWGKRPLEDNWRRSNKSAQLNNPDDDAFPGDPSEIDDLDKPEGGETKTTGTADKNSTKNINKKNEIRSKESYLEDIPNTPEALAKSNENLESALFQMSRIFSSNLKDNPNAIETLEILLARFPNSIYTSQYLMDEYQCFKSAKDTLGMEMVKNRILTNYPNSEYAQFFSDPDFMSKYEKKRSQNDSIYQLAYRAYLLNDFEKSLYQSEKEMSVWPNNPLADKFTFLIALCNAKTGNQEIFKTKLTTIVTDYPKSEVAPLSRKFLAAIESGETPVKVANLTPPTNTLFETQDELIDDKETSNLFQFPDTSAMMVVVIADGNCNKNKLTYNIADYNFERYIIRDFELSSQLFKGKLVVIIEPFASPIEAMDYYYSIRENKKRIEVDECGNIEIYAISKDNMAKIKTGKRTESYKQFFDKNYLKRTDK